MRSSPISVEERFRNQFKQSFENINSLNSKVCEYLIFIINNIFFYFKNIFFILIKIILINKN